MSDSLLPLALTAALLVVPAFAAAGVAKRPFGKTADGTPVELYVLTNAAGVEVAIATYGGIVVSLKTPDRRGTLADVVLGYETLEGYLKNSPYFGAIVGRYGNRIAQGKFQLNGKTFTLARNDGDNHLHGGKKGFDRVVWKGRELDNTGVELSYLSKDGEEGYPGNLRVTVVYTLTAAGELKIDYSATTDKDTVVNLTNHSYFNLVGQGEGDVTRHVVMINADRFTPVGPGLIPTGELRSVKGTPFDFTTPTAIGARIDLDDPQIQLGRGYDHNFVLNSAGGKLAKAAEVVESRVGRVLEVWTTEPGVQFYTGNFLDGKIVGKAGRTYQRRYGFCLETQHFPDSPNKPAFPSTVVKPAQPYRSTTVYKFSVR